MQLPPVFYFLLRQTLGLNVPKLSHRTPPAFTFPGRQNDSVWWLIWREGPRLQLSEERQREREREIRRDAERKVVISSAANPYGREVSR